MTLVRNAGQRCDKHFVNGFSDQIHQRVQNTSQGSFDSKNIIEYPIKLTFPIKSEFSIISDEPGGGGRWSMVGKFCFASLCFGLMLVLTFIQ